MNSSLRLPPPAHMKSLLRSLLLLATAAVITAAPAFAHEKQHAAGPNGGLILETVTPLVEFFVTKDRKIQFTFLDAQHKPVAPAAQSVTVTTGSRTKPVVLKFTRQGDVLLSDAALPEGNNLPAVIQLKASPEAAEIIERLTLNLTLCPECKHAEYACTCTGH